MIILIGIVLVLAVLMFAPQAIVEAFISIVALTWTIVVVAIMVGFGLMALYRLILGYFA